MIQGSFSRDHGRDVLLTTHTQDIPARKYNVRSVAQQNDCNAS